jgi:plasmid stabilization system protein ParE
MSWQASEKTDEYLIAARDFIATDNEGAARDFLDAAFETFEQLSKFPEMGPVADFKHRALKGMRFFVLPPPVQSLAGFLPIDRQRRGCPPRALRKHQLAGRAQTVFLNRQRFRPHLLLPAATGSLSPRTAMRFPVITPSFIQTFLRM